MSKTVYTTENSGIYHYSRFCSRNFLSDGRITIIEEVAQDRELEPCKKCVLGETGAGV